jgi:hypothetical protein
MGGGPRPSAMLENWWLYGESHSPVVHELWVLVVGGSNPPSPTNHHDLPRETAQGRQTAGSCPPRPSYFAAASRCAYLWVISSFE